MRPETTNHALQRTASPPRSFWALGDFVRTMKNTLWLVAISLSAHTAFTGELPDCWFRIVNEKPIKELTIKDIKVLPPPAFGSITVAYWKDVGKWTVKLRSAEPIPGDASGYVSINGYVTYPPLMRQKSSEPTVFAFALPSRELAQNFASGLARLHKIPAESIKTEGKHTWP
jgi:hypothetical protein